MKIWQAAEQREKIKQAVELREKIDQEIDQMMNSMKHVTEKEIQLFLEEVVWDDEDWDDWMRWGEWWTEAEWAEWAVWKEHLAQL